MHGQSAQLNVPEIPIIGGKNCEAVTRTPADGEPWNIGSIAVKGLYTPCHTQDSICWFMQDGDDKVVFTGDTLFHGGESTPALSPSLPEGLDPFTVEVSDNS